MSISEFSLHRNIKVFIFDKYNCYFGCFQLDLSVSSQASVITSQINKDLSNLYVEALSAIAIAPYPKDQFSVNV
jgi:hypothetical protein